MSFRTTLLSFLFPAKNKNKRKARPPGRSERTTAHIAAIRAELGEAAAHKTDAELAKLTSHYKTDERAVLKVSLLLSVEAAVMPSLQTAA